MFNNLINLIPENKRLYERILSYSFCRLSTVATSKSAALVSMSEKNGRRTVMRWRQ